MSSIFVGIAGGSCSGKTTLVKSVEEQLGFPVARLAFDSYYCDQGHLSLNDRALVNYDHPDSLDVGLFIDDIRKLRSGFDISSPIYDFATHTRSDEITELSPTEIILIDGILLLAFSEICDLLNLKIFVSAPEDIRLERRILRDVAERGRTAEQAHTQFLKTVQPMHSQFVEPSKKNADMILDGAGDINEMAKTVKSQIDSISLGSD